MHTIEKGTVGDVFAKALRKALKPGSGASLLLYHVGPANTSAHGEVVLRFTPIGFGETSEVKLEVTSSIDGFGPEYREFDVGYAHRPLNGGHIGEMLDINLRNIRKGDVLRLRWIANRFSNGYTKDAKPDELHADALYLMVERGDKTIMGIHVETSVCRNNLARMIRKGY